LEQLRADFYEALRDDLNGYDAWKEHERYR